MGIRQGLKQSSESLLRRRHCVRSSIGSRSHAPARDFTTEAMYCCIIPPGITGHHRLVSCAGDRRAFSCAVLCSDARAWRNASARLRRSEPWGRRTVYRSLRSSAEWRGSRPNRLVDGEGEGFYGFHSSSAARIVPDVSLAGALNEEKISSERSLKLLSGSCYIPHPDKEDTGGEDAHFICTERHAIGVADGVGGWRELGIDAGLYARELMSNSINAIREEPKGSIDLSRVLEKAYLITKIKGSSTACIITLTGQAIHAVNLGDSGFIVIRNGDSIFRSPVQQHDFNFPYQLECDDGSDLPSSAEVFNVPVASGDVIVAGTDGLFDNLYNREVEFVVVDAIRAGLGPPATAQKIADLARKRAMEKYWTTPFSLAAQQAGFGHFGGKLDDITVVVSYVTPFSS